MALKKCVKFAVLIVYILLISSRLNSQDSANYETNQYIWFKTFVTIPSYANDSLIQIAKSGNDDPDRISALLLLSKLNFDLKLLVNCIEFCISALILSCE